MNATGNGSNGLPLSVVIDQLKLQLAQLGSSVGGLGSAVTVANRNLAIGLLIVISCLIFFMQAGFAFLETGAVRAGNVKLVLFKNFLVLCVGSLAFWAIGYAFGYGGGNGFIGREHFFLIDFPEADYALWVSNFVFAATTSTVATGAMAERAKMVSYLVLSFFTSGFIHPVVAHWAWTPEGWLAKGVSVDNTTVEFNDFAGSAVVHVTGGTIAFLGAAILGPRIGRFDESGNPMQIKGKTATMSALGGFILFFGFLLFISGRHRSISLPEDGTIFGRIAINTLVSGSASAVTSLILASVINRRHNSEEERLIATLNGCLAGLVAVCASAHVVHPYGAFVIGIIAGLAYRGWSKLILRWKVDDPPDTIAVHLGAGIWGVIAEGLFDRNIGLFYQWTKAALILLLWNVLGAVVIIAWTAVTSAFLFGALHVFNLLRLSRSQELQGIENGGQPFIARQPSVFRNIMSVSFNDDDVKNLKGSTSGKEDDGVFELKEKKSDKSLPDFKTEV